ncbi:MAG: ABC transporter permease [Bacillota bacterium]
MIRGIWDIIRKEWKYMMKQKAVFIILFLIPLAVNLLLGFEFSNDQIQRIPMSIYDQDNSSLSRYIIQQFRENEIFDVKFYTDSSSEMKELIDKGTARVGMIVPKDFAKDITELKSPTILMIYDGSHMSIASAAKSKASEILLTVRAGTAIKFVQGKMNLPEDAAQKAILSIQFANRTLYNPAKSFKNFLNPGFGAAIVQTAIALVTAVSIKRNELNEMRKDRFSYSVGKVMFYSSMGGISLMVNLLIQIYMFQVPFRGNIIDALWLNLLLAAAVSSFGVMVSSWVKNEMLASQISAVFFIPSTVMVGYTWPVLSMPRPYQFAARFYPFYHYGDNLRDMYLKGTSLSSMSHDVAWLLLFTAVTFIIGFLGIFAMKTEKAQDKEILGKAGESIVLS